MPKNVKLPLIIALAIIGILACSAFIYFQLVGGMSPDKPAVVATPPPKVETPLPVEPEPEMEVPELDASDETIRSLAQTLSEHPRLAGWLVPENLVRRFVAAVVDVANDESPRPHIGHLEPAAAFRVDEHAGALTIDSGSYDRYDTFATVLDSLAEERAVKLYRGLKPLFDEAYQDLGYPGGDFDVALGNAIDRVLEAPIPAGRVKVKKRVSTYRYVDPDLEALGPVEKQLVRMGPVNARKVQAKLRLFRASLP